MTQERFVATGEHARKQAAAPSDVWLTDRVDGWVEEVKPAGSQAAIDRPAAEADCEQLSRATTPCCLAASWAITRSAPGFPRLVRTSR